MRDWIQDWDDGKIDWELISQVERALQHLAENGKIEDWRGHFASGADFYGSKWWESAEKRLEEALGSHCLYRWGKKRLEVALAALKGDSILDEPLPLEASGRDLTCPFCGKRLKLAFNGAGFVVTNDACPNPKGLVTEFELNVPSGKLVATDDLREWFPFDDCYDVNHPIGCHLSSLEAASQGMAHGFVSNTSPGIYRSGSRFVIGRYDDEIWTGKEYVPNPVSCPWGEKVAHISTSLWWYSVCDYEELDRRMRYYTPKISLEKAIEHGMDVFDVEPGVYRFRQVQGIDLCGEAQEFVTFERVRSPDPVKNYINEEREIELNATEVLIQHCVSWPTLYMSQDEETDESDAIAKWRTSSPTQKAASLARAANHIMLVIGSGVEWHKNGFPRTKISEEVKQLAQEYGDISAFDFETGWYPISGGYGGLCLGAGTQNDYTREQSIPLAPSFVKLGLNICQNAMRFGEDPQIDSNLYPPAFCISSSRRRMKTFADCYRGLRVRYPEIIFDEAFDVWFEEHIEEHIATFDFGPKHPPQEEWGSEPSTIKTGAYFEFDAMKLKSGHFCWNPKYMTGWASKKNAQCYALDTVAKISDERLEMKHGGARCAVPLKIVGRVIAGTGDGFRSRNLEIAFDFGTKDMLSQRWAFREDCMPAVRQFDDPDEYEKLLEEAKKNFAETEAKFDNPRNGDPDFQFVECRITRCGRERMRRMDENGEIVDGDLTVAIEFLATSKDQNGVQGYSHLQKVHVTKDDPILGQLLEEATPFGWTLNKRSVRLAIKVGTRLFATEFKLSRSAKVKGPSVWRELNAGQAKRKVVLSLERDHQVLEASL